MRTDANHGAPELLERVGPLGLDVNLADAGVVVHPQQHRDQSHEPSPWRTREKPTVIGHDIATRPWPGQHKPHASR